MDFYTRETAKAEAARRGVKYRMTSAGMVDFYGRMPGSNVAGWHTGGWWQMTQPIRAIHPNDPDATILEATCFRRETGSHSVEFENGESFPLDSLAWEFIPYTVVPSWLEI